MKFSILLPTRNRLEYLRYAVETVRRQTHADWEIIVSDNHSEEAIGGYVQSLADPRIAYYRTESFVPVTENWNNALAKSTGDYVIMLGDDDGLVPGGLGRLEDLIRGYEQPDFVYTGAYLFAYPGVIPGAPEGFLQSYDYACFLESAEAPFLLPREEAVKVVRAAFDFRVAYGFNMQFVVVRRSFIAELSTGGPFYASPFPDYYAMNVMFLKASRILVCPDLLVVIGVTPKSYGFFFNNNLEASGMDFLEAGRKLEVPPTVAATILPGTNINTSWLLSLETIRQRHPGLAPFGVSYGRYRFLQMIAVLKGYYLDRSMSAAVLDTLKEKLRPAERYLLYPILAACGAVLAGMSEKWRNRFASRLLRLTRQFRYWHPRHTVRGYANLLEAFEKTAPLPTGP